MRGLWEQRSSEVFAAIHYNIMRLCSTSVPRRGLRTGVRSESLDSAVRSSIKHGHYDPRSILAVMDFDVRMIYFGCGGRGRAGGAGGTARS